MINFGIACILTFIVFCNADNNRTPGAYDQVVLNVSHPVTAFWLAHGKWPRDGEHVLYDLSTSSWTALTKPNQWIITALWPSKNDGDHPTSCYEDSYLPTVKIAKNVVTRLKSEWPALTSKQHEDRNWIEAWRKYGTCLILDNVLNENEYFKVASDMLNENNLGLKIRGNSNAFAGGSYSLTLLQREIRSFLGIDGNLQCVTDSAGRQYLLGGSVCFNKKLHREECIWVAPTTCDVESSIYLPMMLTKKS